MNACISEKQCSQCGGVKSLDLFSKDSRNKVDGCQARCKSCSQSYQRAYRLANQDKIRAYRAENRDKRNEMSRTYYKENSEARRASIRAYQAANPEKGREKRNRYRARINSNGVYTIIWRDMRALYSSPCIYCGATSNITADHVVPISRGGQHSIGNLVPACGRCNSSKQDKFITEWKLYKRKAAA